jgi:hypothetical protein
MSSTPTRILATRPRPRPARPLTRPLTRPFPFARIQAAVSASIGPQALAQDPIHTALRGPHAVQTIRAPIIPLTAPAPQADCHTAQPTATSRTGCRHQQSPCYSYTLYTAN